jgi:hypothetical protein
VIISVTINFKYQYLEMLASSKKYQISRGRYTIQKIKKLKVKIIQFLCSDMYVYVKFTSQQALKAREQRYSSTLLLTLALDRGGWSTPRSGRFILEKETQYPLCRWLGGPQHRFGRVWKISPYQASNPGPSNQYQLTYPGYWGV